MNALSDAKLLQQFLCGNDEAFGALFLRHYDYLYGYALQILQDETAAEEVIWQVYVKFHSCPPAQRPQRFRIRENIRAYLRGAVRYGCLDYRRTKAFQASKSSLDDHYHLREEEAPVEDGMNYAQMCDQIMHKLGRHSQEGKVFAMRLEGYPPDEIAKNLRISRQNVYSTWHRARHKAQSVLRNCA
ncbi:MAG: sigma-70 family RNA polymerase sigma factor [Bacteroidetes bacterium]|nr:MAG: sigma-70 family RNA polymerase sigma factor [Bacteroidota bacterium]